MNTTADNETVKY